MSGLGDEDLQARVHRALASVSRVRILQLLEAAPRDVAGIAALTGLHANTVRSHLGVLERADLVCRMSTDATGPGRPPVRYRLAPPPPRARTGGGLETLTEVLIASLLGVADDPTAVAVEAGRPLGRALVGGTPPSTTREALERVVTMLDELGFEPELVLGEAQAEVRLHRCPFDDLARRYGEVVCAAHLGLVRGALEELGARVRADLVPWVEPTMCLVDLSPGRPPA
jgi:predicted ArsR family transcriptional regulator